MNKCRCGKELTCVGTTTTEHVNHCASTTGTQVAYVAIKHRKMRCKHCNWGTTLIDPMPKKAHAKPFVDPKRRKAKKTKPLLLGADVGAIFIDSPTTEQAVNRIAVGNMIYESLPDDAKELVDTAAMLMMDDLRTAARRSFDKHYEQENNDG